MSQDRPLTVAQVADLEQVSTKTVLRAIARGDLEARHVGDPAARRRTWRIDPSSVPAWRNRTRVRPTPPAPDVEPIEPADRPPRPRSRTGSGRGRVAVTPEMGRAA